MKPLPFLLALALLTGCTSAPQKARKIMAPVAKKAEKARVIAERQSGHIERLKVSVKEATEVAEKLNAERPDADTAKLILALRVSTSETDRLQEDNAELRLTISGLEVEIARAQDKTATVIAGSEGWRKWAWRWFTAFAGLGAFGCLLIAFKTWLKTLPVIGPIVSRIL